MSIALESSSNRVEGSGFISGLSCISIFENTEPVMSIPGLLHGDRRFPAGNDLAMRGTKVEELDEDLESCSSSIGRNSDLSGRSSDGEDSGETEVQSSFKGPFDTMDALEEVLPIRRGISKFYCGKSKSFTSLIDASYSSSIKDLVKPDNAYSRKRKNLLACSTNFFDKNRNFPLRSSGGSISKRPTNSNRSTLALAVAMSSSESNNASENSNSSFSSSPPRLLPPLHPLARASINNALSSSSSLPSPRRNFSSWRSFSLTDLQGADSETTSTTSSPIINRDKLKITH